MVDIQKGESDELSRCVDTLLEGVMDGQIERFVMFYSKPYVNKHAVWYCCRMYNVCLMVECIVQLLSMQVLLFNFVMDEL